MKKKGIVFLLLLLFLGSMSLAFSPIRVTVINETNNTVAINYKYDGNWSFPYSETVWDMLWQGGDDLKWLEMPPGTQASILIDTTGILRVVEKNVHNGKWYSKIGFPLQAWWEGQILTIK